MATIQLGEGPGFSIVLELDDAAKTSSFVRIDNAKGADTITFWMELDGKKFEVTANPGEIVELPFPGGVRAYDEPELPEEKRALQPGRKGLRFADGYGITRDTAKQRAGNGG